MGPVADESLLSSFLERTWSLAQISRDPRIKHLAFSLSGPSVRNPGSVFMAITWRSNGDILLFQLLLGKVECPLIPFRSRYDWRWICFASVRPTAEP